MHRAQCLGSEGRERGGAPRGKSQPGKGLAGRGKADVLEQLWSLLPRLGFPFLHFHSLMLSSTLRHTAYSPESALTWGLKGKAVRGRGISQETQHGAAAGAAHGQRQPGQR